MNARALLDLLTAAIVGVLLMLCLALGYGLGAGAAPAPTAGVIPAAGPVGAATPALPAAAQAGRALWRDNNCGSCHHRSMRRAATGPALAGTAARWAAFPPADLRAWVRSPAALIAAGHPRATELYRTYAPALMGNYLHLTDENVDNLLAYVEAVAE